MQTEKDNEELANTLYRRNIRIKLLQLLYDNVTRSEAERKNACVFNLLEKAEGDATKVHLVLM